MKYLSIIFAITFGLCQSELRGIDVSHHDLEIDWPMVKDAGMSFAFIKATQGLDYLDPKFEENFRGAKSVGLVTGAYHFFMVNDSGMQQAEWFIENIPLEAGDLRPVIDIEAWHQNPEPQVTQELKTFLSILEKEYGEKPIIYTSPNFWDAHFANHFQGYPLWIAQYDVETPRLPEGWSEFAFWQYTEKGVVKGVSTEVDLNHFPGDNNKLAQFQITHGIRGDLGDISFLIGHWKTTSTYPNGTKAQGKLKYEAVLGGTWIKFTFDGDHPSNPVWEAHGMIRATSNGHFESYAFFGPGEPTRMTGTVLEDGRFRVEIKSNSGRSGIDYIPQNGGVYQENWQETDGSWNITLRTTYESVKE